MDCRKAYLTYRVTTRCGISLVTLYGEREDEELILHKLLGWQLSAKSRHSSHVCLRRLCRRVSRGTLVLNRVQYRAVDKTYLFLGCIKVLVQIDHYDERSRAEMFVGFLSESDMHRRKPNLGLSDYGVWGPVAW